MARMFRLVVLILAMQLQLVLAQGRLIGVVYDNSSSMTEQNRAQATAYSFKVMSALMVPGDTLALYALSELSSGQGEPHRFPQQRLDDLNRWIDRLSYNSGTPFEPVNIMLRYLQQQGNPHRSIVVFTDGGFNSTIDRRLIDASAAESGIKAGYLVLNPSREVRNNILAQNLLPAMLQKFNGDGNRGGFFVEDDGYADLPVKMGSLFTFISDLSTEQQQDYLEVAGQAIRITSPFPLKNIRLIYQEQDLPAPRLLGVNTSHSSSLQQFAVTDHRHARIEALAGWIHLKEPGKDSARVELTFNRPLDLRQLFIILDTNLELQVEPLARTGSRLMMRNGQYAIGYADSLRLKVSFTFEGSKFFFNPHLRKQLKLWAQVRDGKRLPLNSSDGIDFYSDLFVLGGGKTLQRVVDVFAEYPGHFNFQQSLVFSLDQIVTNLWINGSKEKRDLWDSVSHCDLSRIQPVRAALLTAEGDSVTDQYRITIHAHPNLHLVESQHHQLYEVVFANSFFPWQDPDRDVTLTIDCSPNTTLFSPLTFTTRININRGPWWCRWLPFILFLLIGILIIVKIIGITQTSRFKSRARLFIYDNQIRSHFSQNPLETIRLSQTAAFLWSLLFWGSQRRTVILAGQKLILRAGPGGIIYVTRRSAKGVSQIIVDGDSLDNLSSQGRMDVQLSDDSRISTLDRKYRIEYSPSGLSS